MYYRASIEFTIFNDGHVPFLPRCNPYGDTKRKRKRYKNRHAKAQRFARKHGVRAFEQYYMEAK